MKTSSDRISEGLGARSFEHTTCRSEPRYAHYGRGKLDKVEKMLSRALTGYETIMDSEDKKLLDTLYTFWACCIRMNLDLLKL